MLALKDMFTSIGLISGIISLIVGILVLIKPQMLSYIVGFYFT